VAVLRTVAVLIAARCTSSSTGDAMTLANLIDALALVAVAIGAYLLFPRRHRWPSHQSPARSLHPA
jgi:hypothetical protein